MTLSVVHADAEIEGRSAELIAIRTEAWIGVAIGAAPDAEGSLEVDPVVERQPSADKATECRERSRAGQGVVRELVKASDLIIFVAAAQERAAEGVRTARVGTE